MNYLERQRNPLQSLPGLAAVATLHVALIYALTMGMRSERAPALPPPLSVHVVDRILPPPPPPPPPSPPPSPTMTAPLAPSLPVPEITLTKPPESHSAMSSVPRSDQPSGVAPAGPPSAVGHQFTPVQIISGSRAPHYPALYEDSGRTGQVTVDCMIEASGVPTGCRVVSSRGGGAFAAETLRWLTGASHPVYQPAVVDGKARAEEHQWAVSFEAPQ